MPTDPKLETYLAALEQALRPLPVSDRAEIVTEIKSHVLSAMERDPNQPMDEILAALGAPETVANRYLLERGAKPVKPPLAPIVKWLVFGFLGTLALFLIFVGFVISHFSPLLKLDESSGRVKILGGTIDVYDDDAHVSWSLARHEFSGSKEVAEGHAVHLSFSNGKIDVRPAGDRKFAWSCHTRSGLESPSASDSALGLELDLRRFDDLRCTVDIPRRADLNLAGSNGKIDIDRPHGGVAVDLSNGKVDITPDSDEKYHYDLRVGNGKVDEFTSSDAPDALKVKVQIGNGKIGHGS